MESRMTLLRSNSFDWNDSDLINRCDIQFWICCFSWTVGSSSRRDQPKRDWYFFENCSSKLAALVPLSHSCGWLTWYSQKLHYLVSPVQGVHRTFIPLLFSRAKQGCGILWVFMTSLFLMIWVSSRLESIDVLILYRQFKSFSVIYDTLYFSSLLSSGHSNGWTASKRKSLVNKTCGRKVLNFCHVG